MYINVLIKKLVFLTLRVTPPANPARSNVYQCFNEKTCILNDSRIPTSKNESTWHHNGIKNLPNRAQWERFHGPKMTPSGSNIFMYDAFLSCPRLPLFCYQTVDCTWCVLVFADLISYLLIGFMVA